MVTHVYSARPNGLTGPAYCDTSFVLDLFAHARPSSVGSASASAQHRIKDAHAFYIWARLQGLEFFMSLLGVEEAYQKLLFGPVNGYLNPRPPATKPLFKSWKELRDKDPATFAGLIANGRAAVTTFQLFLRGSGIRLITFGDGHFTGLAMREPRVCRYARALLGAHDSEAMDAFHYALMRRCGMSLAVASDRDWAAFPHGTLVTAR